MAFDADHGPQIALAGTRKSRAMQEGGDSYALLAGRRFVLDCKAGALRLVSGKLKGSIQQMIQVNFFLYGLLGRRGLLRLQKIPAADLDRREAKNAGDAIHVPLHGEEALRRAETPERPVGRRVGGHGLPPNAHSWPILGTPD